MHLPFGLAPWLSWPAPMETLLGELVRWMKETAIVLNPLVDSGPFGRWFCYNPPTWTIAVEFKGSVVVFAFLGAISFLKPRYYPACILLTGLVFLVIYEWALSMFMAGLFLAYNDLHLLDVDLLRRLGPRMQTTFLHTIFFIGWYLLSQPTGMKEPENALETPGWRFITNLTPPNYFSREYWRFWEIPGAALFVYGVQRIPWLQKLLSSRPLRYLGRVSFSFYLVHMPFLWTVGDRIVRIAGKVRNDDHPMWYDGLFPIPDVGPYGLSLGFVLTQAIILPVNLALAEIGTRILDEPSIKMGRWIVERIPALHGK
jgi:peptidoglycan/LPS O-acetylase OafA/YrhL